MGVRISELIAGKEIALEDLAGQNLAVDAFNIIYSFLKVIRHRTTGEPLRDRKKRVTSHLSGLWYRTVGLLAVGVRPIFVFNGQYPLFKADTVQKRRTKRKEAARKWKEAVRKGKPALKYAQAATSIDTDILESAKTLLDLMGAPWMQAPSEGEAQCAWMCQQGLVYATASQDLDSLLFGSTRLVRNLSATSQKTPDQATLVQIDPELIELDKVLGELALTREQLILLGLVVGTDYNAGIKGIGAAAALQLVKEQPTLESLLATGRLPRPSHNQNVYRFFLNPPHVDAISVAWKAPAFDQLRQFLVSEHDFSAERVQEVSQRLQAALQNAS
jgi:flap endonuclease-1